MKDRRVKTVIVGVDVRGSSVKTDVRVAKLHNGRELNLNSLAEIEHHGCGELRLLLMEGIGKAIEMGGALVMADAVNKEVVVLRRR